MQSWSQLHQRLRASAQSRSCAGAMKRSSVRASLTTGATCSAASASMRISSSRKTRGSLVCTTSTPCRTPRSISGTPRKEWYSSSPDSLKYLKRGWLLASSTATGRNLFGDQTGQALVKRHAQRADAARMKAERRGQHQVGAIRLKQISRADIGAETGGDQRDNVHQRVGGLAAVLRETGYFIEGQHLGCIHCFRRNAHRYTSA